MFHFFLFWTRPAFVFSSASAAVVQLPRETTPRPTATVIPRWNRMTQLTDAFFSSSHSPLIPFDDFSNTLDAVFFAGYPSNIHSRFPELILGKSLGISSLRIVPQTDFSGMMVKVKEEYRRRGVNVSDISDEVSIEAFFGKKMVTALSWRTNPPISHELQDDDRLDGMSSDKLLRNLEVNGMVIERIISSLGSSPESEYILLQFLLRDGTDKQSKYVECLKLIEESPRFEFVTSVWPEIRKDIPTNHTRYTLDHVLKDAFRLFSMTSLDITQKRATRATDYMTPEMITDLYQFPVDAIFPQFVGNFNANKAKSSTVGFPRRSLFDEACWLERVYIGKDVDTEILENLKSILGYNPFEGRFDQIGLLDDQTLAERITQTLSGVPNRRQIIGVLLGWIREYLKVIVHRNLLTVLGSDALLIPRSHNMQEPEGLERSRSD